MEKSISKFLYWLVNIAILSICALLMEHSSIIPLGLIFAIIPTLFINYKEKNIYNYLSIILLVMVLGILLVYYGSIAQYQNPYYLGGSDDLDFENYSMLCVKNNFLSPFTVYKYFYWYNSVGYLWELSWIIRLSEFFGGYHTFIGRLFNIYLLMGLSIMMFNYCCKKYQFSGKEKRNFLFWVSLFPNSLYISSFVFRDTSCVFLLFLEFYLLSMVKDKNGVKKAIYTIGIIVSVLMAFFIRKENILFSAIIFFFNILYDKKGISKKKFIILFIAFLVLLSLLGYAFQRMDFYFEYYSGYNIKEGNGLFNSIWNLPLILGIIPRFLYGLVSPFPNALLNITNMFDNGLTFFSVLIAAFVVFQFFLLPFLFENLKKIDDVFMIWIMFFITITITTFTFRHFLYSYPFMWICIFRSFYSDQSVKRQTYFIIMFVVFILFSLTYIIII